MLSLALRYKGYSVGISAPDMALKIKEKPVIGKSTIVPVSHDGLKVFGWGMVWPRFPLGAPPNFGQFGNILPYAFGNII